MSKTERFDADHFILNCIPSTHREDDWTFDDAVDAGSLTVTGTLQKEIDLRERWWRVENQGTTGACVGFACAYGVLRWHYVKAGLLSKTKKPSARFIWMANKETDTFTRFPTTFIEKSGTQTKLALSVARRFGCVTEDILPMKGTLSNLGANAFYTRASRLRISSYHNLGRDLSKWRAWIANQGPILTRLNVDRTWFRASDTEGYLEKFLANAVSGGHAVCIVGYTQTHFIIRNSWGVNWGDGGFAYASNVYAREAFTEAYGAVL